MTPGCSAEYLSNFSSDQICLQTETLLIDNSRKVAPSEAVTADRFSAEAVQLQTIKTSPCFLWSPSGGRIGGGALSEWPAKVGESGWLKFMEIYDSFPRSLLPPPLWVVLGGPW